MLNKLLSHPGFYTSKRPYLTMFEFMRTGKAMVWHIRWTSPSTENALRSLKSGIGKYGFPDLLYVDDGMEYRNCDFSGNPHRAPFEQYALAHDEARLNSAAGILNIRVKFALAKNPRAKPIERDFLTHKLYIDKTFRAFAGGNPVEKAEQLKSSANSKKRVLDFESFKSIA